MLPRGSTHPVAQEGNGLSSVVAFLLVAVTFFLSLEVKNPYYFLQDDNRDHFLPFFTIAFRAAQSGQIGLIDYYHSLGLPLLSNGLSSVLSPFPYISLALSRAVWGHSFAAIDLLVFFYFLIGGLGFLFLADRLALNPRAGLFAACSWCMLPFNVYVAASWVSFAPLVAFFPWIVGLLLQTTSRDWGKTTLYLAGVHLLLLFAGYVQWFLYAVLFELSLALIALVLKDGVRSPSAALRALRAPALSVTLAGILGLPLLLPMWHQTTASAERSQALSYSGFASEPFRFLPWLNGLAFPFTRLVAAAPSSSFTEVAAPVSLPHPGYVTVGLAAFALLGGRRKTATREHQPVMIAAGVLAVFAASWSLGWIAGPIYFVPVLNRFRWLFKLQAFFGFFIVLLAAVGLDRLMRGLEPRRARARALLVLGANLILLGYLNLAHSYRGFFEHVDAVPLVEPLADDLADGRIFTIGWTAGVGNRGSTAPSLGFGFASLWSLHHFAGYDPLMPRANSLATLALNYEGSYNGAIDRLPFGYLRQWGVRYYVVRRDSVERVRASLESQGIGLWRSDRERSVFVDRRSLPLAFWSASGTEDDITLRFDANRVILRTSSEIDGRLTLSLLYSPKYECRVDGVPIRIRRTDYGQMEIFLAAGRHEIEVEYVDPYFLLGSSVAGIALCTLVAIVVLRTSARRDRQQRAGLRA